MYDDATATFGVELTKTNSTLEYDITIKNNSSSNVKYSDVTVTNTNDAITYEITGLDTLTILNPNEELTFKLKILYTDEYQYNYPNDKTATLSFEFIFNTTLREKYIALSGYIVEDTGDVTASDYGAPATIVLQNDNAYALNFTLNGQNNFIVYDSTGGESEYAINANSTSTLQIYIKDTDTSTAIGTSAVVSIMANVIDTSGNRTSLIDTITLTLENKGKYEVLEDGYTETPEEVDYSSSSSGEGGIYSETGNDGKTVYYYRGDVSDNYFTFAGYTWRILRIDENANLRLIMNDLLTDSSGDVILSQFKTTNLAYSQTEAQTLVKLINNVNDSSVNSPIYGSITDTSDTTLRGWYNNTIAGTSYEPYVVDSVFCMDTNGGNAVSSGTESEVYYFAAYQKVGQDTALYDPDFSCPESDRITEKIGLLSVDEFVFAGGAYKVSNTSFFLNDSGIYNNWWTLSPAYYDPEQNKVGVFYVDYTGYTSDWPDTNTIINSYGIRPVITVNGNYEILGSGTSDDPYHF